MKSGNKAILPSALNWPVVVALVMAVVEVASVIAALFTGSIA